MESEHNAKTRAHHRDEIRTEASAITGKSRNTVGMSPNAADARRDW